MENQHTESKLYNTVKQLFSQVGIVFAGIDVGITISKMSEEQQLDMAEMIAYFQKKDETASYILAQVQYDLTGLKAGFLGLPGSNCFSPRSRGYSQKNQLT